MENNMEKNFSAKRALEKYKQINANVTTFLDMKFENGFLSFNETLDVIRSARETLEKNQLVVNGFGKWDYDKDVAVMQLSKAIKLFNQAKYEVSCAIDSLRLSDELEVKDVVWD